MMGFGLISVILVVAGVMYFSKNLPNYNNNIGTGDRENALDVLKKRFANGEISKEEYEEKKQMLI